MVCGTQLTKTRCSRSLIIITGLPKDLVDAGQLVVDYMESLKKEYQVRVDTVADIALL